MAQNFEDAEINIKRCEEEGHAWPDEGDCASCGRKREDLSECFRCRIPLEEDEIVTVSAGDESQDLCEGCSDELR